MKSFIINALASRDLDEIANDHFSKGSLEVGEQFFREFDRKCKQLIAFPQSGKSYADVRADLRGILLKNYVIFYRILPDGIEILRVLNGRRDFPTIFSELSQD
jgi:toxin ParE1/3/4